MTEFKEINCQGIRLVLLWIPIGMDLLNPDLERKKPKKVLKICNPLVSNPMRTNAQN